MSPLQVAFFDDHVLASLPNFIWKPWFGLGIWDLGPPGHCLPTWFSCGFHMVCTWLPHGLHMVCTCPPHGFHVVSTCFHLVSKWFAHGLHMVSTCPPHGFHVVSTWAPHGFHVVSIQSILSIASIHPSQVHELSRYWQDLHEFKQKHANHAGEKVHLCNKQCPPCKWHSLMTMYWQASQISSGSPGLVLGFGIWDHQDTEPPHGFHVVSTWFSCGFQMVCTWFAHGLHMSPTWFSCGFHMGPTWFSCGFHMGPTWFSCGFHMVSILSI